MIPQTLIRKFKKQTYNSTRQRDIIPIHGIRIRQTKKSYPLWEIGCRSEREVKKVFDKLAIFSYYYRFIVECPDNKWSIKKHGQWYIQLVNIESELTKNEDVV